MIGVTEVIDLMSPIIANHHRIVSYIAYELGKQLGFKKDHLIQLEIAGALHDIGGMSLFERLAPTEFDYKDNDFHAEKGFLLLNSFQQFSNIATMIRYHHVNWMDVKYFNANYNMIPFESHILNLADRISVLINVEDKNILNSANWIRSKIESKKGKVFHPKIVEAFMKISEKDSFWLGMLYLGTPNFANQEKETIFDIANEKNFEDFILLMSYLIDFKSRFTATHSASVAACSKRIAEILNFSSNDVKLIRYAGYIHDLGKLAIPVEILEKTDKLTSEEFSLIRTHAYHTYRILSKIKGFEKISIWGSLHHEKLNGKGYPFNLKGKEIPLGARIMAVADVFTALRETRPYRDSMTKDETMEILKHMSELNEIDKDVVELVRVNFEELDSIQATARRDTFIKYEMFSREFELNKNCLLKKEWIV
jgi:HD-GYP domain-containing protein (c-di-GMP phosphodiesterase class II)